MTKHSRLGKTFFANLDRNTRLYLNLSRGKVGLVSRRGKTLFHAGLNSKSTGFVRLEHKLSKDSKAYAYVKPRSQGAGIVKKIGNNASGKIGVNNTGPFIEGRYRSLKLRHYIPGNQR